MIFNVTTGRYLSGYPEFARDPFTRTRGMIGRRFVCGKFDALVFRHCGSVHSCFMRYSLDLVFLDRNDKVVSVREKFQPWRLASGGKGAMCVIELPPGAIAFSQTKTGDIIDLNSTNSSSGIEKLSSGAILLSESFGRK